MSKNNHFMKTIVLVLTFLVFSFSVAAQSTSATTDAAPAVAAATPASVPAASPTPSSLQPSATPNTTATAPASAAKGSFVLPLEKKNPVDIPKFEKPPQIDGNLNDAV